MHTNNSRDMLFHEGDLMLHQTYMEEAGRLVWEILEYRRCSGPYASDGDHAWLSYGDRYIEPFSTREQALKVLADIEMQRAQLADKIYAWRDAGGTLD